MSVSVLTPASTSRLTTIEAVMAEITLEDQLPFAESLIDQASQAIARECRTVFAQQAYREVQGSEWNTRHLFLRFRPLVSVTSVSHSTEAITDYRIESSDIPMLYRPGGWLMAPWHYEDWQIDYVAGYILPEQLTPVLPAGPTLREHAADLERACIETVKVWFHERLVDTRIEARTLGDQRIDYGVQARHTGIPVLAKDLLMPWKRMVIA